MKVRYQVNASISEEDNEVYQELKAKGFRPIDIFRAGMNWLRIEDKPEDPFE